VSFANGLLHAPEAGTDGCHNTCIQAHALSIKSDDPAEIHAHKMVKKMANIKFMRNNRGMQVLYIYLKIEECGGRRALTGKNLDMQNPSVGPSCMSG
jgi:hypothetical protein